LALVDLNLEGMSGDEMVRKLKQNPDHARLPIVFISGVANGKRKSGILKAE